MLKAKAITVDEKWYRETYNLNKDVDPTKHYFSIGWQKGYNPSPNFDGNKYLKMYPDVAKAGQCPLTHYNEHGKQEGREIYNVESTESQIIQMKNQLDVLSKNIKNIETWLKLSLSPKELPSASGYLRMVQLANVKILKEVKRVCEENNLVYWLDFGSLLGAHRHGGFIPWDDDIDICMLRQDYQRFIEIFNKNKKYKMKAFLASHSSGMNNVIKVALEELPLISMDVFPVDFRYKLMSDSEKLEFSDKLKSLLRNHAINYTKYNSTEEYHQSLIKLRDKNIKNLEYDKKVPNPTVFYGLEFYHITHKYCAFDYDTIFPLSKINFEGISVPTVHKIEKYLMLISGNYGALPTEIRAHDVFLQQPVEFFIKLQKIIEEE